MLRRLYDWVMSLAATRHAERALAFVSFIESSIFPIPPDALLIPMVLADRRKWFRIALVCTIASVLGAYLGYAIGAFFFDLIGRPILELYGKADAFAVIHEMGAHHPDQPHWYLPVIGTQPDMQGQGHGSALLRPVLEICDRTGVPAYLEATTERNRALYARHGFVATAEIRAADCPPLTAMVRRPG